MTSAAPASRPTRRAMPLRHKLMLVLACEVLLLGFQRADLTPRRAGILIEAPALAHHVIT
ncbi:hypothetical protein [Methylobacterium sp. J-068]|uniref:hypothetical protein n=1 Tax=Methylobacterium sp. J-068 TaxID=2836649 RepID=UPI001FB99251|nr:hypothetical protein [Methylobacterium sp. J-068]MCJ2035815.1 hypothetical protein [Methylobacterium sp. J-068]